jgi:hypothetical protein
LLAAYGLIAIETIQLEIRYQAVDLSPELRSGRSLQYQEQSFPWGTNRTGSGRPVTEPPELRHNLRPDPEHVSQQTSPSDQRLQRHASVLPADAAARGAPRPRITPGSHAARTLPLAPHLATSHAQPRLPSPRLGSFLPTSEPATTAASGNERNPHYRELQISSLPAALASLSFRRPPR